MFNDGHRAIHHRHATRRHTPFHCCAIDHRHTPDQRRYIRGHRRCTYVRHR